VRLVEGSQLALSRAVVSTLVGLELRPSPALSRGIDVAAGRRFGRPLEPTLAWGPLGPNTSAPAAGVRLRQARPHCAAGGGEQVVAMCGSTPHSCSCGHGTASMSSRLGVSGWTRLSPGSALASWLLRTSSKHLQGRLALPPYTRKRKRRSQVSIAICDWLMVMRNGALVHAPSRYGPAVVWRPAVARDRRARPRSAQRRARCCALDTRGSPREASTDRVAAGACFPPTIGEAMVRFERAPSDTQRWVSSYAAARPVSESSSSLKGWLDRVACGVYASWWDGALGPTFCFRFADSWPPLHRPEVCDRLGWDYM
jgi:hypothetical protein